MIAEKARLNFGRSRRYLFAAVLALILPLILSVAVQARVVIDLTKGTVEPRARAFYDFSGHLGPDIPPPH